MSRQEAGRNVQVGKRNTRQRALLLGILREGNGHLDASALYRRARDRSASISLSTVYRALRLFRESGLVEAHQLEGTRRRYEPAAVRRHYHLVCLSCGRVAEFECALSEAVKQRVAREKRFQVTNAEVRLEGYCASCIRGRVRVQASA